MKITISHNKSQAEVKKAVDRSLDDLFKGIAVGPLEIVNPQKTWEGSTMTFGMTAKMGFMSAPIRGTVLVTDKDITIDADLGFLENLLTPKTRASLETRVKGLLT
ncbi:MAG: polyhydroxyalkanoic acid system family protein [Bryobacteraceae bacterium]